MDTMKPPQLGTVIGRDLNNPNVPNIQSTFGPDPFAGKDVWGSNDHDIITEPNGWVLLIWGFHLLTVPSPKPAWFDVTTFGSGAYGAPPGPRRGTIVYRSEDCGASFHYVSYIDPATLDGGLCAFPQHSNASNAPPPPYKYLNGGTDGQLAKVSVHGVYLTMDCVGFRQDITKPSFTLSTSPISRTYVLRSIDDGNTWQNLGFGDLAAWREGIVVRLDDSIITASSNFVMFAQPMKNGLYNFGSTTYPTPLSWGWADAGTNPVVGAVNNGHIVASTLLARVGTGETVALAYPATVQDSSKKSVDGYALYFFRPSTKQFANADPMILPLVHESGHFLMHMVAIEPNPYGPVLLYWYDLDGNAKTATIRGRFIYNDGTYSQDFDAAEVATQPGMVVRYSFSTQPAWYGDYQTAGGYAHFDDNPDGSKTFDYFPMWVQSDGTARYSHVSLTRKPGYGPAERVVFHPQKWRAYAPRPVDPNASKIVDDPSEILGERPVLEEVPKK